MENIEDALKALNTQATRLKYNNTLLPLVLQLGVLLGDADRWIKGVIKGWPVAISTVLLAGRDRHISVGRRVASLDDQADIGQRLSVVLGDVIHARVGQ